MTIGGGAPEKHILIREDKYQHMTLRVVLRKTTILIREDKYQHMTLRVVLRKTTRRVTFIRTCLSRRYRLKPQVCSDAASGTYGPAAPQISRFQTNMSQSQLAKSLFLLRNRFIILVQALLLEGTFSARLWVRGENFQNCLTIFGSECLL